MFAANRPTFGEKKLQLASWTCGVAPPLVLRRNWSHVWLFCDGKKKKSLCQPTLIYVGKSNINKYN